VRSVLGFLALYMALFALSTVLLAGTGVDFITALGAVAATIGNIGPGFGLVGPVDNFAQIPYWGKWLLSWCMLLGAWRSIPLSFWSCLNSGENEPKGKGFADAMGGHRGFSAPGYPYRGPLLGRQAFAPLTQSVSIIFFND
jgi:hypothetical protein